MIKALLLIAFPIPTWERIAAAKRKWPMVLFFYFLPFLLLTCLAEGYGLVQWGKPRGRIPRDVQFSVPQAVIYEVAITLLTIGVVFLLAMLIKSLGETFHGRHSFNQAFTVAAFGLGPMLLFRLLDAFPRVSPWLSWVIGIFLVLAILYTGLPIVMQPDPPHALGLYLMTSMMVVFVTGLARFVTAWYLQGKFPKLDALVSSIISHLHL
jgi:Yip1 domain